VIKLCIVGASVVINRYLVKGSFINSVTRHTGSGEVNFDRFLCVTHVRIY